MVSYYVKGGYIFFCLDQTTFSLKPYVTRGWFLRGSRPVVEFNWTRKRFHAYGVINGEKEHYRFYDEINWRTVIDFLRYLHRRYPKLLILWDGAPWHKEHHVKAFLKRHDIKTLKFPPYSPEENPTEQVWKTTKHAAANTYFPDAETYRREIRRILRQKILTKMFKYLNH